MIYLILCIVCTGLLVFMFKVFDHFKIAVLPAIVFNYIVCVVCGFLNSTFSPLEIVQQAFHSNWLWLSALLGFAFIYIFVLISKTALQFGVSTASVAMKLGLVVPVLLAFTIYGEQVTLLKILGILCAFAAVVLSSLKEGEEHHESGNSKMLYLLPAVVFIGSGLCDSAVQFSDKFYFQHGGSEPFVLFIFLFAGIGGMIMLAKQLFQNEVRFQWNQVVGGIALGIPNYGSLLFLLKALNVTPGGSSVVFPISNIATVAFSTFLSVLFFKEKLSKLNLLGLGFSALCIVLIALSK